VEVAPPHPGDIEVERFLRKRMAEGGPSRPAFLEQAGLDQLGETGRGRQLRRQAQVELLAEDGRRLRCLAGLRRDRGDPDQDRFADRVRDRDLVLVRELEPLRPLPQRAPHAQRGDHLLDEEGRTHGPVADGSDQRRRGSLGQQLGEQLSDPLRVERLQRQLLQLAAAPQLVAQPAQPVVAREAVGAVGGDDEDRHLRQRGPQRRQQLERRFVGPLEVVEDDDGGPLGAEVDQGAAHRLEDRRPFGPLGGVAELGQQQGEVGKERTAARQRLRIDAQPRSQCLDDRAVGHGDAARREPAQNEFRPRRAFLGEAALADPRLAAQQQQGAASFSCSSSRGLDLGQLGRPADERGPGAHLAVSLGAASRRPGARPGAGGSSVGGRNRVRADDHRVGDRDDLVAGQAGGLGVGADRLRAVAFVDTERPDLAALLAEHVAADPANARPGFVADLGRPLAGDLEVAGRRPAVASKNSVELHCVSS
jgi:hypothetical protein